MIQCSAPGKIFLTGEYAVLSGSPAVVSAVNRRATAVISDTSDTDSPLMQAIYGHTIRYLESVGRTLSPHRGVSLSSTGFRIGKNKLGLGSSAAVAAGGVGALFELSGLRISDNRTEILRVAKEAHCAAQNGKGSGADVAAAVLGGTIVYSKSGKSVPVDVSNLYVRVVWSGRSVSTAEMIDNINRFKASNPKGYRACMARLETHAVELEEAFSVRNPESIIHGARRYAAGMDALGVSAGVPIVTKPHRRLINIAEDLGGAAKPSGAGGGDIAVAFFTTSEAAEAFRVQCIRHELPVLDLALNAPGLKRDVAPD